MAHRTCSNRIAQVKEHYNYVLVFFPLTSYIVYVKNDQNWSGAILHGHSKERLS
jgi:hypothetical protein